MRTIFRSASATMIFLIAAGVFLLCLFSGTFKRNRMIVDAPSYYTYLPAAIIEHDLSLRFMDRDPAFYNERIWYYRLPGGQRLIKHPLGESVLLSPFFVAAHVVSNATGGDSRGYSLLYQNFCAFGVLLYLIAGLIFLRRILLRFVSDHAAAWAMLIIFAGTDMLWYATEEPLMPHILSFSVLAAALHFFLSWLEQGSRRMFLLFVAAFALSVLLRPLAITIIVFFLLYLLLDSRGKKILADFCGKTWKDLLLAALIFLLIVSPQLLYWHYISSKWILDVYMDEHFVFSSPQFFPFLFGFRKGFFIYAPLMLLLIPGLVIAFRKHREIFWPVLILFILTVFILSSWWAWSYGISWGLRPMIDYLVFLSLPLALFIDHVQKKLRLRILQVLIVIFISLNLFQTWQYSKGLIHFDDMTAGAYFKGFLQTAERPGWRDLLRAYDWERRLAGLPQIEYSSSQFSSLSSNTAIHLRGSNDLYVGVNPRAQNVAAAYLPRIADAQDFFVQHLPDDKVYLRSSNGLYLTVTGIYDNILIALEQPVKSSEFRVVFKADDDNRISLQAINGKYISADIKFPYALHANGAEAGAQQTFRYFVAIK